MSYYLMNAVPHQVREQRERTGLMSILALEGGTLPVFTSLESFWDFAEVFYPKTHALCPVPFEIGAYDLADLTEQMMEMTPTRFMVFDPVAISAERCDYVLEPISITAYRRFVGANGSKGGFVNNHSG